MNVISAAGIGPRWSVRSPGNGLIPTGQDYQRIDDELRELVVDTLIDRELYLPASYTGVRDRR